MFTGIIKRVGKIVTFDRRGEAGHLAIDSQGWSENLELGESICTQGVCLTITKFENGILEYDLLAETLDRSNLGSKQVGDPINLERSLALGEPLGGHIVQGHVDGVGRVSRLEEKGQDHIIEITCDPELCMGMVFKGSICLDGISLTIASLEADRFTVHIIPHTWDETSFFALKENDPINLEVDIIAKYIRKRAEAGRLTDQVSWESLREEGFEV